MVSDNIKKIRQYFGMTQIEFAEKLGVSSGVITNIEYNRLQSMEKKMPLFRLISDRFGVPLDWILSDNPGPLPMPEASEADAAAKKIGGQVENDPVVKSFLEFWGQRTEKEREQILKAMDDFYEILKANQNSEQK